MGGGIKKSVMPQKETIFELLLAPREKTQRDTNLSM